MYVHNSSVWFGEFRNSFDLSGLGPLRIAALGFGDGALGKGAWSLVAAWAHDFLWIVLS